MHKVAWIGFGEAANAFAEAAAGGAEVRAFDIAPERAVAMKACGVAVAASAQDALEGAHIALCLVTADQALAAAETNARYLAPGALWCDFNSVAPQTKRDAARAIEAAGGHYVDVAVLSPVYPKRLAAPLLLAGAAAQKAHQALTALGFTNVRVVGESVGRASTIKMVRSVMVKGIEALTDEMMAAAEAAGVADEVLASLDASETTKPWRERAAYNIERMTTHGARRAAEMEEAAKTLTDLGVEPLMTRGTIRRQRDAAGKTHKRSAQ